MTAVGAAWFGNALYAIGEPGGTLKFWSPGLVAAAMVIFFIVHGYQFYSARLLLLFTASVFSVSWLFETTSVLTGFPFGNFHYAEMMRPFIGHVPVFVMLAYCVMGYVSWSIARAILRRFDDETDWSIVFIAPILAAALMVVWDISMDPLRATIEGRWIWLDAGVHYGVPLKNYLGWGLVTWIMFQFFALMIKRLKPEPKPRELGEAGNLWLSAPLMYVSFAVEYVLNPFISNGSAATVSINGVEMAAHVIYQDIAIAASITMIPPALIAGANIHRSFFVSRGDRVPEVDRVR